MNHDWTIVCRICGNEFEVRRYIGICPVCGSDAYTEHGKDFCDDNFNTDL